MFPTEFQSPSEDGRVEVFSPPGLQRERIVELPEALALGAFAVFEKPLASGQLCESIREAAELLISKVADAIVKKSEAHQIP